MEDLKILLDNEFFILREAESNIQKVLKGFAEDHRHQYYSEGFTEGLKGLGLTFKEFFEYSKLPLPNYGPKVSSDAWGPCKPE
ncbi:MAG: hypothetical protein V1914_01560 [archaeon]